MSKLQEILSEFKDISAAPKKQFNAYLDRGKKVIGCMPYFCPEELVHAAGMVPFGLWGAETRVSEARSYLPAFICSIIQTTLELGIRGSYDGLSAVMIPILCDSLKSMDGNWRYGVKDIPVIPVAHAQNRKTQAGAEFTASQYRKVLAALEQISGKTVTDDDIRASIAVYNKRNATVRRFIDESAKRPGIISPSARNAVFKSGYFLDASEYTEKVGRLVSCIENDPPPGSASPPGSTSPPGSASPPESASPPGNAGARLITCGIIADNTGLLKILDECGVIIIDDVVTYESLRYRYDAPENSDPVMSLALLIGDVEGCPVLYDPGKKRGDMLVSLVRERAADGVLFVMTKFCDPEEYDIVPLKRVLDKNGIRSLSVEVDQQTTDAEQIRTALETFCEILKTIQ